MRTADRMVHPVVLSGHDRVKRALEILDSVSKGEQTAQPWIAVRCTRRARVTWCVFSFVEARALLKNADEDAQLYEALKVVTRPPTPIFQLDDWRHLKDTPTGLILDGTAVVAYVPESEPETQAARPRLPEIAMDEAPKTRSTRGARPIPPPVASRPMRAPQPSPSPVPVPTRAAPRGNLGFAVAIEAAPTVVAARVELPAWVRPAASCVVVIGLQLPDASTPAGERFQLPGAAEVIELDVQVVAPDFTARGGIWRHTLSVKRSAPAEATWTLQLQARALESGSSAAECSLTVYYSHRGVPLGMAVRKCVISETSSPDDAADTAAGAASTAIGIGQAVEPVDLTIRIAWFNETPASGTLLWTFESAHAIDLPQEALKCSPDGGPAFARDVLSTVTSNDGTVSMDTAIRGLALTVADAMPPQVFDVIRSVWTAVKEERGADAIPTVLLLTAEASIPWELAYIEPPLDPARPSHLLSQLYISRWMLSPSSQYHTPPTAVTAHNVVAVVGSYQPGGNWQPLPNAQLEGQYLKDKYEATSLDATPDNLNALLNATIPALPPGAQLIHFAGHGEMGRSDAVASTIIMNDGTAMQPVLFRAATVASQARPFVFLNACQVGTAQTSLGNYAGFAGMCMRAGFSGIVAPLWSVNDIVARDIAENFYAAALAAGPAKRSAAAIFHGIRSKASMDYAIVDPATNTSQQRRTLTPLAYVVYGHPNLTLTR